jgi:hypothetical protein
MSTRLTPERAAADVLVCMFSIAALAASALGQPPPRQPLADRDKLAWLGCWDVMADPEDDSRDAPPERQRVCVAPGENPKALEMTVLVDAEIVATETIVTDGSRQPVSDGGCDGWIRSILSEDRRRLYLQSEATCSDGELKNLTGASMIVSGNRWIDIHALRADGDREVLVQRYRPVDAGIARLPGAFPSEMHTVRLAAAEPLSIENVIEALQFVDPSVVEVMLLESDARFGIDSDLLLRLDAAGLPDEVIDLMVALSFSEYFAVEDSRITRLPEVYYGGYWSPWYPYYGYGHYYHYRYSHADRNRGGKVISGRGYVQVQQTGNPSGGIKRLLKAGSSGGGGAGPIGTGPGAGAADGGSANHSGYQGGNSAPKRPAIPK